MTLITSQFLTIDAVPEAVWRVISDIRNSTDVISGIKQIEVLEEGSGPSIVGLKWKETREWMGNDAVEVMWVTDAREPEFYETRAESHGCVYRSTLAIEAMETGSRLTMEFHCQPESTGAKIMWLLTGWMAKRSLGKAISQDLSDIKSAVEQAT